MRSFSISVTHSDSSHDHNQMPLIKRNQIVCFERRKRGGTLGNFPEVISVPPASFKSALPAFPTACLNCIYSMTKGAKSQLHNKYTALQDQEEQVQHAVDEYWCKLAARLEAVNGNHKHPKFKKPSIQELSRRFGIGKNTL